MTLFHLIQWTAAFFGMCGAAAVAGRHFGAGWALLGGVVGLLVGNAAGAIPRLVGSRLIVRELEALCVDDLRRRLRESPPRYPNFVLHELRSRGETSAAGSRACWRC